MTEFILNNTGSNNEDELAGGGEAEVKLDLSPLAALRTRREQLVNELYIDVKVPRWESPEIYIRFKPVSAVRLNSAIERRRKQKGDDWSILANADMLIDCCIGVYAVVDGNYEEKLSLREGNPRGPWTKIDKDLAFALGVEAERAVDACLGLFFTEGDLIDVSNKLFKWSGIAGDEVDEDF